MIIIKIQAGLGNQLFQYATARALSYRYNTDLKVDLSFYNNLKNRNAYRLDKFKLPISIAEISDYDHLKNSGNIPYFFRLLKRLGISISPYYKKTHIVENDILKLFQSGRNLIGNYYLEGWFFNIHCFQEYRGIIINDLCGSYSLSNDNHSLQNEIKNTNSVAVHIRRGDFLTNAYFKLLPKEYYNNAITLSLDLIEKPVFYFFSNDPKWVKKEFATVPNARFVGNNSVADTDFSTAGDVADLMLIRSCKHQIIANSSFSWWGAWLNENPLKKIFYPAIYYNNSKAQKQYEKNSFIPSDWIKIKF
jgi:hypothetical protein